MTIYAWADGKTYKGEWSVGKMKGLAWACGKKYEGSFINDKKGGPVKFFWPDGHILDGEWKGGKQHGAVGLIEMPVPCS